MSVKTTLELRPGDKVLLGGTSIVRTVREVVDSGRVNSGNQPIYTVNYVEPGDPKWGSGNTGTASTVWRMA